MTNHAIFLQVSNLIRSTLWDNFTDEQRAEFGLNSEQSSIVFSSPADSDSPSNRLSLWLYHIEKEAFRRGLDLPLRDPSGNFAASPPISFDLFFLVTPLKLASVSPEANLSLLGRVIEILQAIPVFDLTDTIELNGDRLSLELLTLPIEEMCQIWSSMGNVSRQLSVVFKVRGAQLGGFDILETPVMQQIKIED